MPILKWISDKDLKSAVSNLLNTASLAKKNSTKSFNKNVIDPFSAVFEISGFEIDYATWLKSETTRQAQKTLQNHIGDFHQTILGLSNSWENMKTGNVMDLVSHKHKIIAEVKNKFNTISGGKLSDLYHSLQGQVMPKSSRYKGYTAYYVAIIPKKPKRYDIEFTPSNKEEGEKCPSNKKIRETDGASFYDLVTGHKNALETLFDALPDVISECSDGKYKVKDKEKLKEFFNTAYKH
ncbi:Eco47II family restriction endonuclease [Aurantibacillus circumpalustris]|uniref:Eco47II family restriction endonuclease n=1 Tax=Aurantibacillus circumpalustris TaxID=3036359 RepID=UPI00295BD05B|nr:Eco47II family restriction endonuclease [Aurantibacillus circumpalustris]